jgi:hypothetical protein
MPDPEINEVRHIRHGISERHGHDVKRLIAHYQRLERQLRVEGRFRFADPRQPAASQENTR